MSTKLSKREIEVVGGVRLGLTNKEIGRVLQISPTTVKTHIERICEKLKVNNRVQIALKGLENRMIKPFCFFDRNLGGLRFETLREMRNARMGEPREIALYTHDQMKVLETEIVRLQRLMIDKDVMPLVDDLGKKLGLNH